MHNHVHVSHLSGCDSVHLVVLADSLEAETQPPWNPSLVLHVVVVDPVRRQALHQLHVTVEYRQKTILFIIKGFGD